MDRLDHRHRGLSMVHTRHHSCMYMWKVWFRVADPLPGLPYAFDLQSHRFKRGHAYPRANSAQPGTFTIFIVLSGVFAFQSAGSLRTLGVGDVCLFEPGSPDRPIGAGETGGTFIYLTVAGSHPDWLCGRLSARIGGIVHLGTDHSLVRRLANYRIVYQRMVQANPSRRAQTAVLPLAPDEAFQLAAAALAALVERSCSPKGAPAIALIDQVEAMVHNAKRFDFSATEIAQRLGCSRRHVTDQFREAGLPPPASWLRQRRLREAERMLASGSGIGQVAQHLGFSNASNFSRAYSKFFGRSPKLEH